MRPFNNISQKFYDIRSDPFDDPSSDHHSAFFLDANDDVVFVFEGSKRLTTVESPVLLPLPAERFRFFNARARSERSVASCGGNGKLFPFSHSRRCRRYTAIAALASVTYAQT